MELGSKYLTGYVYKKNVHRFILTDQLVRNPSKLKKKITQVSHTLEECVKQVD